MHTRPTNLENFDLDWIYFIINVTRKKKYFSIEFEKISSINFYECDGKQILKKNK